MDNSELRIEVLKQTRQLLTERDRVAPAEAEEILKLLDVLIEASTQNLDSQEAEQGVRQLAMNLVENQSLLLTLKQQAAELDALKKLSLNLTSSLDLPTVLDAVVTEAMRLVKNARNAHIFLYNLEKQLEFGAALNYDGIRNTPLSTPRKNGLTHTVARTGKQIIIQDMGRDPLYKDSPPELLGSIIGIPLKFNHTVVGVMNLSRTVVGEFTSSELRLLGLLADQAAVAISNARLHQMVSQQAYSDTVTGLPNRRALDERLEDEVRKARRGGYTFAVIMMDLDGFKLVNDTHGHDVGDQVLRSFFGYLSMGLRSADFLARYGGDELTLILSQTDPSAARVVAEKIMEKVEKFYYALPNGYIIKIGLSGGIALYPLHASTAAYLLRAADEALYRAKKHNRGSFMVARGFTGELNQEAG